MNRQDLHLFADLGLVVAGRQIDLPVFLREPSEDGLGVLDDVPLGGRAVLLDDRVLR